MQIHALTALAALATVVAAIPAPQAPAVAVAPAPVFSGKGNEDYNKMMSAVGKFMQDVTSPSPPLPFLRFRLERLLFEGSLLMKCVAVTPQAGFIQKDNRRLRGDGRADD